MSKSSLSSVVSSLVRASMGTSLLPTVTDEDLDREIAELILKEAKQKAQRYGTDGIQAYLRQTPDSALPRTNKRFLSSIIRSTDDHNKTILKAQALAAQEVKAAREEIERQERRARAREATAAGRMRRLIGGAHRRDDEEDGKDRKRRQRSWERRGGDGSYEEREYESHKRQRRHRHRSRSIERVERPRRYPSVSEDDENHITRHRHRVRRPDSRPHSLSRREHRSSRRQEDELDSEPSSHRRTPERRRSHTHSDGHREDDELRSRKRRRRRSPSATLSGDEEVDTTDKHSRQSHHRRSTSRSPLTADQDAEQREVELRLKLRSSRMGNDEMLHPPHPIPSRSLSPSEHPTKERALSNPILPSSSRTTTTTSISPRSPSLSTPSPPNMNLPSKMDKYFEDSYDPRLDVAPLTMPKVPATGLIDNAEFEGWDAMLELIRIRREDKEEKRRLERLGLGGKDKDKKKKGTKSGAEDRWEAEGATGIMDIQYKKKGTVREWDMGKEDL